MPRKTDEATQRCPEMLAAVDEAYNGIRKGHGGPFGAVIVDPTGNIVVSAGHNTVLLDRDSTAHAEMNALRKAIRGGTDLNNCMVYTTCEPCPMCWSACHRSGIKKLFVGASRDIAAEYGFDDQFFYDELKQPSSMRRVPELRIAHPNRYLRYPALRAEAIVVHGGTMVSCEQDSFDVAASPLDAAGVLAIQEACRRLGTYDLVGCKLIFPNREPTPLELTAAWWSRVSNISYELNEAAQSLRAQEYGVFKTLCSDPRDIANGGIETELGLEEWACRKVFEEWQRTNAIIY